jgi:sugar phosphate isomerase/epimerase
MGHLVAYSTNAYTRHPLPEAIRRIGRLGFDGVEILADAPHLLPDWGARDQAAVAEALKSSRLGLSNVNVNTAKFLDRLPPGSPRFGPTFIDPDPKRRGRRLGQVLDAVAQTAVLGGEVLCVCSGPRTPGVDDAEAWRLLLAGLEPVAALAEAKRVRVGIEYEPGFLVGDADATQRLLADLKSDRFGVNLDLGHAVVCGEDPARTVERFGDRIWNCHIEDIRDRVHHHRVIGEGDIDFGRIRRALDGIGYTRYLTLELYTCADRPDEAGRASLAALRTLFA